jgi:phage recombination protein Bet
MDTPTKKVSLVARMAADRGMEKEAFYDVIKNTIMPREATDAETAAFLLVADRYNLDPLLKHIHCFFDKRTNRLMPIISIDGWSFLVNQQPQYDGVRFEYTQDDDGKVQAITCNMFRKDRTRETSVTEFLSECWKNTDAWKSHPARMLRHRAFMQAARLCFGFSGAMDEDEQPGMVDITPSEVAEAAAEVRSNKPRPPSPPKRKAQSEQQQDSQPQADKGQVIEGEATRQTAKQGGTEAQGGSDGGEQLPTPEIALQRFSMALTAAKSVTEVEDIALQWDIRAALTHRADLLELAEAKIEKTKARLRK